MNAARHGWHATLQVGGMTLLVLAALPLVAVAAFFLRGVLFAASVVVIVGAVVAYAASARFRSWVEIAEDDVLLYKGLRLPAGVALTTAHVWTRVEGSGASVGLDDLAQAAIGPLDQVELPAIGTNIPAGDPLFAVRRGRRAIVARAPLGGRVVAVNGALRAEPSRLNRSPFDDGWAVRLEAPEIRRQARRLLRGAAARDWFREEVDRLLLGVTATEPVAVLPDGGVVSGDLHRFVDDATWARLEASFFGGFFTPEVIP